MSEHARWVPGAGRANEVVRRAAEEERRAIELGRAVRECRLAVGLSQTALAERAGTTQSAVSRLEAGDHMPTIAVLDRFASALGVDLSITFHRAMPSRTRCAKRGEQK